MRCGDAGVAMIAGVVPRGPARPTAFSKARSMIFVYFGVNSKSGAQRTLAQPGRHRAGQSRSPGFAHSLEDVFAMRRVQRVVVSGVALLEPGIRPIDSSPSLSAPAVAHPKIDRLVASLRGPHEENDKERF
jgi:hypothetical protein